MIVMLIGVVLLIALDQFAKYLTVLNISEGSYVTILNNIFGLSNIKNIGDAFVILQ